MKFKRKKLSIIFATFTSLLSAGIIFGFSALRPTLIKEGTYKALCLKSEYPCVEQSLRLSLLFSFATSATNLWALPGGIMLDKFGPKYTMMVGSVCLLIGTIIIILSSPTGYLIFDKIDGYIPGFVLLSIGGPTAFISTLSLANYFPKRSGLILSILMGAFDASSGLFYIFSSLYNFTGIHIKLIFLIYLAIPLIIFIGSLTLLPCQPIERENNHDNDEAEECLISKEEVKWKKKKV